MVRFRVPRLLWISFAVLFLASAELVAQAADEVAAPSSEVGKETVLARVNGEPITDRQVLRRLKAVDPKVEEHRSDLNRWMRLTESAMEAEIRDRLLLQAARAEGLEVSPDELSTALARSRELLGAERYAAMLANRGATEADYAGFLGDRLLIDKYRAKITGDLTVDDENLRDYYRGHKASFVAPARVRLEVVETTDVQLADRTVEQLREGEPLQVLSGLAPGVRSKDEWVNETSLPPDLRAQIEAADLNAVLGPIEVAGRFRVIRLRERQASRKLSFEESKDLIRQRLLQNREQAGLDAWYEQAKRTAKIEYP